MNEIFKMLGRTGFECLGKTNKCMRDKKCIDACALRGEQKPKTNLVFSGPNELHIVLNEHGLPEWVACELAACNEQINDAIERNVDGAEKWVVRTYIKHPGYN